MTTILHADLIRAVLDGKTVQWALKDHSDFRDFDTPLQAIAGLVNGQEFYEFRIKPESLVMWAAVDRLGLGGMPDEETARKVADRGTSGPAKVLRLELDPDTLKVISAETEEP